jgi:leader peptidase (prepilin peptidase)/N-methyltransferase
VEVLVFFSALLAACFASFLAVVAERLPRHESLNGRSHCTCGRVLGPFELVPVISFVALRGRARCCGSRLPRHLLVGELGAGLAAGVGAGLFGLPGAVLVGVAALALFTWWSWGR